MATEKLIQSIDKSMPDEGNIAVVISSSPQKGLQHSKIVVLPLQSKRTFLQLSAWATEQSGRNNLRSPAAIGGGTTTKLQQLPATSILWTHIEKQQSRNGDSFYIHHSQMITAEKGALTLKHMGFAVDRTQNCLADDTRHRISLSVCDSIFYADAA